jgi:hypothetical protein
MKVLVLNFQGAETQTLFSDERLENLHRLMDLGCFGKLTGPAEWDVIARQENHTLTLMEFFQQADKQCADFDDFAALTSKLESGDWDYCQLTPASFPAEGWSADDYLKLDQELGEVLQHLSDDTILCVLGNGCFVLVSENNPIEGELKDGSFLDVAPTLLELAGFPLPSSVEGKSWVTGMELKSSSSLSAEEEEILRDRLSGLGYI